MRIIVISPLLSFDSAFTAFIREELEREAAAYGYHYSHIDAKTKSIENNSISILFDDANNSLLKQLKRFRYASIIKRLKAYVVVQLTGLTFSNAGIRQYHAVTPTYYDRAKVNNRNEKYAFNNRAKILNDKNCFLVSSDRMQKFLNESLDIKPSQIHNIHSAESLTAFDSRQKEHIKEGLTDGMEFFYTDARFATNQEIIQLLKAFSVFKKWQRSSMQLVLRLQFVHAIDEELSNYKFRDDIRITQTDDVLPAAYAIVQPYNDVNAAAIRKASMLGVSTVVT